MTTFLTLIQKRELLALILKVENSETEKAQPHAHTDYRHWTQVFGNLIKIDT